MVSAIPRMKCLKTIIAHSARRRETNMDHRECAFQPMVSRAVQQVGSSDRKRRSSRFDSREQCVMIHKPVAQQNFLASPPAHIQRREIIQRSRGAQAGEKPDVLFVKEGMLSVPK